MKALKREKLASLFIFFSFYMVGFPMSLFMYLHQNFKSKTLWYGYIVASIVLNVLFTWIALSANLRSIGEKINREKENQKEIELTNENLVSKI
jgi:Na+-driven multidrug efflux pump